MSKHTALDLGIRRSQVSVVERPDGWVLMWDRGEPGRPTDEFHETGAAALAAIRERDRTMADAGFSMFTVITWEPTTTIGRQVVQALQ